MDQGWQPDAIVRIKLDQIKKDFFDYIEKNIDKIDANIPVFYGHVVATLEKSFPDLNDDLYDKCIDSITSRVLDASRRSTEIPFVEKLFDHAIRNKRRRKGRTIYDILLGLKMVNCGNYSGAIEQLKPHRSVDAVVCPSISYCFFVLSTREGAVSDAAETVRGPNEMALDAREQMIEFVHLNPPVNRLKDLDVADDPRINTIFWFMIKQSIEWFPGEREFIRIGLEKASRDGRSDIREELLSIAIERFSGDLYFLRELYKLKLERRDAGGVAGVVRQMTQQYPDDLEPLYYGMKLSVITARVETYYRFRKLALTKNMPQNALVLLDFAFELMIGKEYEALACLEEIKVKFGHRHHYVTLLEYVAHDFFSEDEQRIKPAKKALIESIDQYCLKLLKIRNE